MEILPSNVGRKSSTTTSTHSPYCQNRNLGNKLQKDATKKNLDKNGITERYHSSPFPLENFELGPSPVCIGDYIFFKCKPGGGDRDP